MQQRMHIPTDLLCLFGSHRISSQASRRHFDSWLGGLLERRLKGCRMSTQLQRDVGCFAWDHGATGTPWT